MFSLYFPGILNHIACLLNRLYQKPNLKKLWKNLTLCSSKFLRCFVVNCLQTWTIVIYLFTCVFLIKIIYNKMLYIKTYPKYATWWDKEFRITDNFKTNLKIYETKTILKYFSKILLKDMIMKGKFINQLEKDFKLIIVSVTWSVFWILKLPWKLLFPGRVNTF